MSVASSRFWGSVLFFSLIGVQNSQASIPPSAIQVISQNQFGQLKIGDQIEALPSISRERKRFHATGAKPRFGVHYFNAGLPAHCLNLECGPFARQVLAHGGFLVGGADDAYIREMGAEPRSSVWIVTDANGKVTSIYKNVSTQEIRQILASIHD